MATKLRILHCVDNYFINWSRMLSEWAGIATEVRAGRSGDRITVVGRDFPHPSRSVLGAHPASYTMGTGSYPGVKRPGRGADYPPTSSAEVKQRIELYLCSPSANSWLVLR